MTRVWIGMAMALTWTLAGSPAMAATAEPEIKIVREGTRATITLTAGTLTLTQTLTPTTVSLRVAEGADVVRFSGDLEGRVTLQRGEHKRSFALRSAKPDDQAAVTAMLADSRALAAFDQLLQSPWAQSTEATLFRSTREVVRVLEGDYQPVAHMAWARPATPSAALLRVRQRSPSQCWDTYARDVIHFTYELQSCLNSASYQWWNPFATAWCAYEYNLKSSLASIWLLDCYGVPV